MKINVFDHQGKKKSAWELSEKLGSVNSVLLAQALRIYESNSHQKTSRVKTRGEVNGSTRKIYRQKGTGNARHGARYAPIFVGGGIAHGPKGVRADMLILPKKMRRKALASAILLKAQNDELVGLANADKLSARTATIANLLSTIANHPKKKVLVVSKLRTDALYLGLKNIQGASLKNANLVNALDLVSADHVVLTQDALDSIMTRILGSSTPLKKTVKKADKK